jgi:hypothetical protein
LRHRTESAQAANQVFHRNLHAISTLPPSITKAVDKTCVNQKGTAGDETFKVALTVNGDGGTSTSITPIDVVFALDSSGSMNTNDPNGLRKTASQAFVDKLVSARDTAGVVSWDGNIDFALGLTNSFQALKIKIGTVNNSGSTNLNVGLSAALNMLVANTRTAPSNEIIIFLTDGDGDYTTCANNGPAKSASDNGIAIYSIGLGSGTSALADMATCTGGQSYPAATTANLDAVFTEIFDTVVNSSIPHNVDVLEVIEDGIDVNEASITPTASSVAYDSSGRITSIRWNDIDDLDSDDGMEAGEVVLLSYEAKSAVAGSAKKIDVAPNSKVFYTPFDDDSNTLFVATPQNTVNVNAPPSAVCKTSTKEAGDGCSACFGDSDVDGGSNDPYTCPQDTPPTLSLTDPVCFGVGGHTVTLTATDDNSLLDSCDAAVTVEDTTPPIITCPSSITLDTEPGVCTATVPAGFLATSTDVCDSFVTTSLAVGSTLLLGHTTVTFTATDATGNEAIPCDAGITVNDNEDPTFDSNLPECLWPVNHKYFCMDESTVVTAADNCPGASTIKVTACTSNQDENAIGDGDSVLDCVVENGKLCLRAERQGITQEDRVYTVTVEVTDVAGNTASMDYEVDVPHNQNPPRDCVPGTIKGKM